MMQNRGREASISVTLDYWFLRALAWALLFTGFVLSAVSTKSCRFLDVLITDKDNLRTNRVHMGLFQMESGGFCIPFERLMTNNDHSTSHKVARAMAVLACLIGAINMLLVLSSTCCPMAQRSTWILFGALAYLCVILQCFTFIFFNDDQCDDTENNTHDCRVGKGAAAAIAAIVAYLFGGILTCMVPPPSSGPLLKLSFDDILVTTDTSRKVTTGEATEGAKNGKMVPSEEGIETNL